MIVCLDRLLRVGDFEMSFKYWIEIIREKDKGNVLI